MNAIPRPHLDKRPSLIQNLVIGGAAAGTISGSTKGVVENGRGR